MSLPTHVGPDLLDLLAAASGEQDPAHRVTHLFTRHMGLWCGRAYLAESGARRRDAAARMQASWTKTATTSPAEATCTECLRIRATAHR